MKQKIVAKNKPAAAAASGPQDLLAHAGRALQSGDLIGALRRAEAATSLDPSFANAWHVQAIACHHLGYPDLARRRIGHCLRARPGYAEAWNTLGNLGSAAGDASLARPAYRASIALAPDFPDPYNNLGVAEPEPKAALLQFRHALRLAPAFLDALLNSARQTEDSAEAARLYERVLLLDPSRASAWNDRGLTQGKLEQWPESKAAARRAHRLDPANGGHLVNLANAATRDKDDDLALAAWEQAVLQAPGEAAALLGYGLHREAAEEAASWLTRSLRVDASSLAGWQTAAAALLQIKQAPRAIAAAKAALCLAPDDVMGWAVLSRVAGQLGAMRELQLRALHIRTFLTPLSETPHLELGDAYIQIKRQDLALTSIARAIELQPQNVLAWSVLATARRQLWLLEEALESVKVAMTLAPAEPTPIVEMAVVLYYLGRPGAYDWYRRAELFVGAEHPQVQWNRSLLLLAEGQIEAGLEQYEAGLANGSRKGLRDYDTPRWDGEDISGKRILAWREQGVGDELVFASCIPDLIAIAGHCIVKCDPRLTTLFTRSFPGAEIRPDLPNPKEEEDFDVNVALGSLPRFFRRSLDAFPDRPHFLTADSGRVRFWRQRFEALGGKLIVGICWRGRLKWLQRMPLYAQLRDWGPILRQSGITFVSMQYADPEEEIAEAEQLFGCKIHSWQDIDLLNDFDDVAAFSSALDLAIVADTAGGALAGALGVPTFRYVNRGDFMSLGTDRFPWMPSIRVFTREPGDPWAKVTQQIADVLSSEMPSLVAAAQSRALQGAVEETSGYVPQVGYLISSAINFQRQGKLDAAIALYQKVLCYEPAEPMSLQLLGTIGLRQGRLPEAQRLFLRAVQVRPDYVPAYVQLAVGRRRAARYRDAIRALSYALAWDPGHPEALTNHGECLAALGDAKGALRALSRAALLRPELAEMEINLGNLRGGQRDHRGAALHYRRAVALRPGYLEAYLNLGAALSELADVAGAEHSYRRALAIDPGNAVALGNCGDIMRLRGNQAAAQALFEQTIARPATTPEGRLVQALIALESGHLQPGWQMYRDGLTSGQRPPIREWPVPLWDGSPLAARHLLIWREQGTGDELTFASVYPDVLRSARAVTIETDVRLVSLFARSFPAATVRADTSRDPRPDVSGIDVQAPAGDVASFLRPSLSAFDSTPAAFLTPDPRRVASWKDRLRTLGPGAKVGICWRSIQRSERRNLHYATPAELAALLRLQGVHLVNLQYGMEESEGGELAAQGLRLASFPDLNLRDDFEGTAALLSQLDAVVGPETTMTALAGALGRPTFLFRHASWLSLGTDAVPWMPAIRVFPRVSADWSATVVQIADALDRHLREAGAAIDAQAIMQEAVLRHRAGDWVAAERAYQQVLAAVPDEPDAHQLLGALRLQRGDLVAAQASLQAALICDPAFPQGLTNLGRVKADRGDLRMAEPLLRRALRLQPAALEATVNLGSLMSRQGRAAEACLYAQRGLQLNPAHPGLWSNLGDARIGQGDLAAAYAALHHCLRIDPGFAQAHVNLGKAALAAGLPAEASDCAATALRIAPNHWHAQNMMGMAKALLGRPEEAEAAFRQALETSQGDARVRWNLALLELRLGNLAAGWEGYEAGLETGERRSSLGGPLPRWPGPGASGRVLVRREQGLGDELMFATCLRDLIAVSAEPVVECDARLRSLLQRALPEAHFIAEAAEPPVVCQWQIAAGSLPGFFRREIAAYPQSARILPTDPKRVSEWRQRLRALGARPKIGLCWRSSVLSSMRSLSYAGIEDLEPVLALDGFDFISLQHDASEQERQLVRERFGVELISWPDIDLRDDLEDLAALTASLDLVIAADTAVGALAGVAGASLWKFMNRIAWSLHGTDREPWLPEARIFVKESPETWQAVFQRMAAALREQFPSGGQVSLDEAMAAIDARRFDDAERLLQEASAHEATAGDALAELSGLARASGQIDRALVLIEQAMCRAPANPRALTQLGLLFKEAENFDAATTCHLRALRVAQTLTDAWINLGNSLEQIGAPADARLAQQAALSLDPANAIAWTNLGGLYSAHGEVTAAARCYRLLSHIEPGSAVPVWNLALLDLGRGALRAGWAGFRSRFDANPQMPVRHAHLPRWRGEDLPEQGIVVWSEQGIGDELVFASCLPDLLAAARRVIVECDPRLISLWRRSFPSAEFRALGDRTALPGVAYQAPSGDVAAHFRSDLTRFPDRPSHLVAASTQVGEWRPRLDALGSGPKVGICWRGLRRRANRRSAYTDLAQWAGILSAPGIQFVSLQYGEAEEEIAAIQGQLGCRVHQFSDLDLRDDIDGAAALITGLDLVIGPDTAVTALAGALGRPTWKLSPANDWLRLGSDHYPWLPSVRVFEKTGPDWSEALATIAGLLRQLS